MCVPDVYDGETCTRFGDGLYAVPLRLLWETPMARACTSSNEPMAKDAERDRSGFGSQERYQALRDCTTTTTFPETDRASSSGTGWPETRV